MATVQIWRGMTVLGQRISVLFVALLGAVALLAPSPAAWGTPPERVVDEDPQHVPYVAGELIITHRPEAPPEAVDAVGREFGAQTEERLPQINARLLSFPEVKNERFQEARQQSLARIKQALEQNPVVEAVDYNYLREASYTPNDPRFDEQWGPKKIRAPQAWEISEGEGMDVAVVDTGIDSDHPDLQAKVAAQRNFVTKPESSVAEDDNGHGTHVAGIPAAVTNNGTGIAGVCPGCNLLVAKVLNANGSGTDADIADGIIWAADNGAEVVNLSLGGPGESTPLKQAVNYAWRNGAVVAAAAGNSGDDTVMYPAAYANAIAVAATNQKDKRASFSTYGSWVDAAAPGVKVLSTYLSGGYKYLSGTSTSAPHVSGLAGLLAAQGRSAPQIRGIVESTAVDLGPLGKDKYYGWGRINARAAVSCSIVGTPQDDTLRGTAGNDVICSLGGSDEVVAAGGHDRVFAGPGNDVVRGGSGRDTLIGSAHKDRLFGNAGHDRLNGKDGVKGNDYLHGGAGEDRCSADKKDHIKSCP